MSRVLMAMVVAMGMVGAPLALADHAEVTVTTVPGSGVLGNCVEMETPCYVPYEATVDVGGTVIFSNTDSVIHTFSSGVISNDVAGTDFDSELVQPGDSFEWVPEEAGEYPYFCKIHPWASGVITVEEAPEPVDAEPVDPIDNEPVDTEPIDAEPVDNEPVDAEPVDAAPVDTDPAAGTGGGCLIATATYGTEMAPQVQKLREIRDGTVMGTESGSAFMGWFNDVYYSFSPAVADLERQSPIFKEMVKVSITPMVSSLSILDHVDIDTEMEMLGYGISLILLNGMMYVGAPAFGIVWMCRRKNNTG